MERIKKVHCLEKVIGGFARALKRFFACPSIPKTSGFKYRQSHNSARPRNVEYGVESNIMNTKKVD